MNKLIAYILRFAIRLGWWYYDRKERHDKAKNTRFTQALDGGKDKAAKRFSADGRDYR